MGILLNLTLNKRLAKKVSSVPDPKDDKQPKFNDKDEYEYQTLDNYKTFEEQGIVKSDESDGFVTL